MLKKMISMIAVAVLSVTVSANVSAATITVHKGDTLWDLSRVHNTSVDNIQMLNHLTTDLIYPGDKLTIAPEKHYTVKQGDTLWDISMEHHTSVSLIKEWNHLNTDLIHPGLNLLIFDGINTNNTDVTGKTMKLALQESKENAPVFKTESTSNESAPAVKAAPAPRENTQTQKESAPEVKAASTSDSSSKEITVKATAYTASCEGCSGITATGINIKANPNKKVIAVDPSVIPLGSKVYVEGYGEAIAGDTGGAIKGNRIDIFIPSEQDAVNFGVKKLKVKILN
ncbi:peptidoglycan-binding protein [Bacillus sp. MUM 116]|uniref:3D domain-containing protein n=1 Tax=Bacillus sp. MUM 116 TaxID=1678002 RepID=UPI0008F5E272|nr:3D domain-containing protein [Bacillus sp. MUM 116]OIK13050.1 peptidoglycan-binding protein [Bacillus sp. MUM 116]